MPCAPIDDHQPGLAPQGLPRESLDLVGRRADHLKDRETGEVLLCTDLNGTAPLAFLIARQASQQPTLVLAHARTRYTSPDVDAHFVTGPDWGVSQQKLATLPEGEYALIVSIRTQQIPRAQASQRITIGDGGLHETRPWPSRPNPDPKIDGTRTQPMPVKHHNPSADSRIIYVSSSTGNDRNDGLSPQTAVRSAGRGYALLRDGQPDWLLFRRGDTFQGGLGDWKKSGRSLAEPMLVGSFGEPDAARPRFHTGGKGLVSASGGDVREYLIFSDLHGYANTRDPDSREFDGGRNHESGVSWNGASNGVLFENLLLEYYSLNIGVGERRAYDVHNISIHRCVLRNAYMPYDVGHSQGLFADRVQGLRITECILDHNGWNEDVKKAGRTGFNQNVYLYQCDDVLVEGCVLARGSNLGLKLRSDEAGASRNAVVQNNLFIDNLTGMSVGSDPVDGDLDAYTHENLTVRGNVFTQIGGPINSRTVLGIGLSLKQINGAVVENNLFVDKGADTNWYAIEVSTWMPLRDISIRRNVVHRWDAGEPLINGSAQSEVDLAQNMVNLSAAGYQDASRSVEQYLLTQTQTPTLEAYCDAVASPVGVDLAGPYGGRAIVEYMQQGFAR